MPTTIPTTTLTTRPGSPSTGDAYFETDTNNYIIYDGANWRGYVSDGETLGANGYSLDLDGTDDRVELGNATILNSASAFSISLWVKSSSTGSTMYMFQSGTDTYANSISFYRGSAGTVDFLIGKGGSSVAYIRYGSEIFDGSWKHLVATFGSSTQTLYLNGSVASTTLTGTTPSSTVSTAGTSPHIGSNISDSLNINGKIDDIAIFSDALTASEVSNIYTSRLYNPSKLAHLYRFENNYNDSKGSLNGTAQGNPTFDSSDKPY